MKRRPTEAVQDHDERVVAARAFIRERVKADRGLLAIGDYLLDELFEGDPAAYAARGRKEPSLRALLKEAGTLEIPISKTGLSNALRLAVVTRQLGGESHFAQLPQSLAIELLPLRETHAIELLAIDIEASEMTVREIRQAVRDLKPKTGAGRPRRQRILQVLDALERVFGDRRRDLLAISPGEVATLSAEERVRAEALLTNVRVHSVHLQEVFASEYRSSSDVGTLRGPDTAVVGDDDASAEAARLVSVVSVL